MMKEFGKRQRPRSTQGSDRRTAARVDLVTASEVISSGKLPYWADVGPLPFVAMLLAAMAGCWFLILPNAAGLLRDYRFSGTWQPAYDMKAEADCTRYQLLLTICDVRVRSVSRPEDAPLAIPFMMAFSTGDGEAIMPVRSAIDPSAITIAYAAQTKRTNRTLTFFAMTGLFSILLFASVNALLRGRYVGGAAHRALQAGLNELSARADIVGTPPGASA